MIALLCTIFFLSGAAALLFETLWFQQAGLVLGNSVWASSLVMAGFMGGLALGNGLAARWGARVTRPLALYAGLEVLIAATGIALVYGFPAALPLIAYLLEPVLDIVWLENLIRLGVAFLFLLIPSTAMGATLPLLVKELVARDAHFGRALGRLYGWNTLGAVTGALVGHHLMTSAIGVHGSAWIAAGTNGVAALGAAALWRGARHSENRSTNVVADDFTGAIPARGRWLLIAAALCGAIMLALEVVWFRFLLFFVHGTTLTFSIMLAVVLVGIGLGGLVGGRILGSGASTLRGLPLTSLVSGGVVVATYSGFGLMGRALGAAGLLDRADTVVLSICLMLPNAVLSGVLFTMIGGAFQAESAGSARPAGLVTLANTLGAMLGSVVGGFFLLPGVGIEGSIQILAGCYAVSAWTMLRGGIRAHRALVGVAVAILAGLIVWVPAGSMDRHVANRIRPYIETGFHPIAIREGLTETTILLEERRYGEPGTHKLVANSFSMSATNLAARRYMKLFVYWPVAMHPDPKSALLISYGVGATAQALVDTDGLETIDVVDISKDILELSELIYPDPRRDPLKDARVRVHVEDGRHFLETRTQTYDLITGEPPPPKIAGVTNLFSQEYFEAIHDRLNDGGITTYWLPVHGLLEAESKAILRAFCEVFEDCSLWNGSNLDWIMIGSRGGLVPPSASHFARQWSDPAVLPELQALGLETPEQLGATFMADAPHLQSITRDTAPLDDDHPGRVGTHIVGPLETLPLYRSWVDAELAGARFAASPDMQKLWPAAYQQGSRDAFEWQGTINRYLAGEVKNLDEGLPAVDHLQDSSTLETLPLWLMGSTYRIQDQVRRARRKGRSSSDIEQHRIAAAIATRDYEAALRFSSPNRPSLSLSKDAWMLRIYAMVRAGQIEQARASFAEAPGDIKGSKAYEFLEERLTTSGVRVSPPN